MRRIRPRARRPCADNPVYPALAALCALAVTAGCASSPSLDREALMDPAYCESCHPDQYRQWAGSMHAYSSDDPIFIALNRQLQDETDGAAGTFCVGCHAPMAARTGATTNGLDLDELPRHLRGVTCYFCHTVDHVEGPANNALRLADDGVMRGAHADPFYTEAHKSGYSELHDGRRLASSGLCGSCHDVVTPAGVHLERTYAEWQASIFAQPGPAALSCNRCHMPGANAPASTVSGSPERRVRDHGFPGIDVALTPWPGVDEQLAGIERDLQPSVAANLCVTPSSGGVDIEVVLDNLFSGHSWPSGVTHARRAWVEVIARAGGEVIYESGAVAPGQAAAELDDPDMWLMRSRLFDADGAEVHEAWKATTAESELLPAAVTNDPTDPAYYHAVSRVYEVDQVPDSVSIRLQIRPVGLEMIDGLVAKGLLDPEVRDRVPTFELRPAALTWTAEGGFGCVR